ncbi:unnamed protein product, partial [Polarella glacialis]
ELRGCLLELSQDPHGTRVAQKVVEEAVRRGMVDELLEALPTQDMSSLACSVTGFHVVVKLLELLPDGMVEPLLETFCSNPKPLASDQWGCCVLKKCIDRSQGTLRDRLVDTITENIPQLVEDPFGNYVVQHLILMGEKRPTEYVTRVIDSLQGLMLDLCFQKFSSNVLEKCLQNSSDSDRNKIINELLNGSEKCPPSEAVRKIIFHQFGNYVFQQALEVAQEPQFSLLVEHSKQHIQDMVCRNLPPKEKKEKPADAQGGDLPVVSTADADALLSPVGSLSLEHAKRLATKLVKKYPALAWGLAPEALGLGVGGVAGWYCDHFSAYAQGDYAQGDYDAAW